MPIRAARCARYAHSSAATRRARRMRPCKIQNERVKFQKLGRSGQVRITHNSTSLKNTARSTFGRLPAAFRSAGGQTLTPLCGNITPCAFHCISIGAAQNCRAHSVNYGETKNYGENRNGA
jgi:hypothetical protein